jgi:hypothetical protein
MITQVNTCSGSSGCAEAKYNAAGDIKQLIACETHRESAGQVEFRKDFHLLESITSHICKLLFINLLHRLQGEREGSSWRLSPLTSDAPNVYPCRVGALVCQLQHSNKQRASTKTSNSSHSAFCLNICVCCTIYIWCMHTPYQGECARLSTLQPTLAT